ncbi:MAG TPA: hydroxymethylbilane synthase [Candidatus Sulfomarinibacteraceae bacterium]|nr:hydroxymethylbilane synthase [Candidatus Sulfomarinibacteraceae bacterium]
MDKITTRTLTFGTRTSRLARWQTAYIVRLLEQAWPNLSCKIIPIVTRGDRVIDKPLPEIGGKGLFTAELEEALREGQIDLAVHSLKDLPVENSPGLTIGAIPQRAGVQDGLVARNGHTLETLPPGSVVGTSSLRRQAQLLAVRPDLRVKSIRGNVGTRVRKALEEDYDATVLAAAGLQRLEMEDVASDWLSLDVMLPAPGQGALAVQCRADDAETLHLLEAIEDPDTRASTVAERHFLQTLGGGCSAPIAAFARPNGDGRLEMTALIAAPDGGQLIRVQGQGDDARQLGESLAQQALQQGAQGILDEVAAKSGVIQQSRPLQGLRVVVTRARPQAPELADRLRALGAEPVLVPTIRIAPVADTTELDQAINSLSDYDWVIFTSVNGVSIFWERIEALGKGKAIFEDVRVSAIGPATGQALAEAGVEPDFVPDEFVAERIAEGLGDVEGLTILLPRAELARATLADMLVEQGARVEEIATYRTLPALISEDELAQLEDVDLVTFTSSSTVRNFVDLVGGPKEVRRRVADAHVACIGPITAGTAAELEMPADIVAETYTMDGLVDAIRTYYKNG